MLRAAVLAGALHPARIWSGAWVARFTESRAAINIISRIPCRHGKTSHVLENLVGLRQRVRQPMLVAEPPGQVLEPVVQVERLPAVAPQLANESGRDGLPREPAEDKHRCDGPP